MNPKTGLMKIHPVPTQQMMPTVVKNKDHFLIRSATISASEMGSPVEEGSHKEAKQMTMLPNKPKQKPTSTLSSGKDSFKFPFFLTKAQRMMIIGKHAIEKFI
jgi:hypothetical protein